MPFLISGEVKILQERKVLTFFLLLSFFISLATPILTNDVLNQSSNHSSRFIMADLPTNSDRLQDYEDGMTITTYDAAKAMNGLNLFSLSITPNITERDTVGYMLVTDMEGNIVNGFYSEEEIVAPRLMNSTSVTYAGKDSKLITFWNMETNETLETVVPAGHHEWDYNPLTNQFVVFEGWTEDYYNEAEEETYPVSYDDVVVYNIDGSKAWQWSCNETFPFNYTEFHLRDEVNRGEYDWTHTNSLFWDADEGAIYVSVRHLDCIVKIDANTGETDWVVGRYTGTADPFTLYNIDGEIVDSIFYHTHALEKTGPDTFCVYDNDFYNLTRTNPEIGITRYVRFEVNETAKTAQVIWTWTSPANYYQNSQGNADLLPNGDVVGSFNNNPEPWFTEVNSEGEIVWEMWFNITENNAGFKAPANAFERFVEAPIIEYVNYSPTIIEGNNASVSMSVWDTFKRRYSSDATIRILEGTTEIAVSDFTMLPLWQETILNIDIAGLSVGAHELTIEVANEDGIVSQETINIVVDANLLPVIGITAVVIVAVVVVVVVFMKKK